LTAQWVTEQFPCLPETALSPLFDPSPAPLPGQTRRNLYESTIFTWQPELRRAVREAGWSFDPEKR